MDHRSLNHSLSFSLMWWLWLVCVVIFFVIIHLPNLPLLLLFSLIFCQSLPNCYCPLRSAHFCYFVWAPRLCFLKMIENCYWIGSMMCNWGYHISLTSPLFSDVSTLVILFRRHYFPSIYPIQSYHHHFDWFLCPFLPIPPPHPSQYQSRFISWHYRHYEY